MQARSGLAQVVMVGALVCASGWAQAQPQPAVLASPRTGSATLPGGQGVDEAAGQYSISADGRYVAFASASPDLTPSFSAPGAGLQGDANGVTDIFVRDLVDNTTLLVSRRLGSSVASGNGASHSPVISADGSVVVFISSASDLVAADGNAASDVFVWARATDTTTLASLSSGGVAGDAASGLDLLPQVSADGRHVLFASLAGTLAPNVGSAGRVQLFVRDRQAATTTLVTVDAFGAGPSTYPATTPFGYTIRHPRMSPDGAWVSFLSYATDLVVDDTNRSADLFLRDMARGLTRRVCPSPRDGDPAPPRLSAPAFSGDSHVLAFDCDGIARPGDSTIAMNVFRRDLASGATTVVSATAAGIGSVQGDSRAPAVDWQGDLIAFTSRAPDVSAALASVPQVYLRDVRAHVTTLVSRTPAGRPGNGFGSDSTHLAISHDGRYVAFVSDSTDLVSPALPGSAGELFVADRFDGASGTTWWVSGPAPGAPDGAAVSGLALAARGTRLAFASRRATIVAGDANGLPDLFALALQPAGPTAPQAILTLTGPLVLDEPETFVVAWQNPGVVPLRDVVVTVDLPAVIGTIDTAGLPPDAPKRLRFPVGTLAPGATGSSSFSAAAEEGATGPVTLFASVAGSSDAGAVQARAAWSTVVRGGGEVECVVSALILLRQLTGSAQVAAAGRAGAAAATIAAATLTDLRESTFYALRDRIMVPSVGGLRYADLYRRHAKAITDTIMADATRQQRALDMLVEWQDDLQALVDGRGASVVIPADRVSRLVTFLEDLAAVAPAELASAITDELTRFPVDALGGMTMADAARLLGVQDGGMLTRYFAEGTTGSFFRTIFALANASTTAVDATLRFLTATGQALQHVVTVPALGRATVDAGTVPGLAAAEFSTVVQSSSVLAVDRRMTWDPTSGYGSHVEASLPGPATTWYFAEGATHSGFDLFYLFQNPDPARTAQVEVRYLRASGAPLVRTYPVAPASRFTLWVDQEQFDVNGAPAPVLAATDVSAAITVTNGVAIVAERAMYLTTGGPQFTAGHESAGVVSPAPTWTLAEGATGSYFDLFVLVANPQSTPVRIRARYLLPSGQMLTKEYDVAANARFNIWVDREELPVGSGQYPLADTAVSTTIEAIGGEPIVVERAMWWPGPTSATWTEAHNSPGATNGGQAWAIADAEVGGTGRLQTYVLIANVATTPARARVTLLREDGETQVREFDLLANSRFNVDLGAEFSDLEGRRVGVLVESLFGQAIVVERAIYGDAGGVTWASGANALATRVR